MYPDYNYQSIPVIVEALCSIPKSLNGFACQFGCNNMEVKRVIKNCN